MIINIDKSKLDAETLEAVLQDEIIGANAEYELNATDYIMIKITECIIAGDAAGAEEIRERHAATIEHRKQLRIQINAIKDKWENKLNTK